MNNARRKTLREIAEKISEIKEQLENVCSEEQDAFDAMPESLQGSDRGEASSSAISEMENAVGSLDSAISDIENIE